MIPEYYKKSKKKWSIYVLVMVGVFALLSVIVLRQGLLTDIANIKAETADLDTRIRGLSHVQDLLEIKEKREKELRDLLATDRIELANLLIYLDEVIRVSPRGILISNFTISDTKVSINGESSSYALVPRFIKLLEGSELFTNTFVSEIQEMDEGYKFILTSELGGLDDEVE